MCVFKSARAEKKLMSQCEQLAKSQRQGRRLGASAKKSQENTYVECIF